MNIRKATFDDLSEISRLLKQVLKVHSDGRSDIFKAGTQKYTEDELKGIITNENTPIFVCVDDEGRFAGYAFCVVQRTKNSNNLQDRNVLYIDDLCVDSTKRRMGIGKRLFEYVKDYATEHNFDAITLNVWCFNTPAMKFYESLGMKPLKTIMEYVV